MFLFLFFFLKIMISTFLWAFAILIVCMITKFLFLLAKRSEKNQIQQFDDYESIEFKTRLQVIMSLLKRIFSFYEIIDSKFIGLIVFLNSNILTGLVNLSTDTKEFSVFGSMVILILHAFASVGSGYLIYLGFKYLKRRKSTILNNDSV